MAAEPAPSRIAPLQPYARDVFSQNGEDGILERVFELLGVQDGWCVEFGAWDGHHLSNTANLIESRGWSAVLIEADPVKSEALRRNMAGKPVTCIEDFVGFDPPNDLAGILKRTAIPQDFELLSIDIDGPDFHVWESLRGYEPKVVVIEINPTAPNHVEFVQARDMSVRQGSTLKAVTTLARRKGYEPVAVTITNGIFVRSDLVDLIGVEDRSLDALRPSRDDETYLIHLYDGTLLLGGRTIMPWHRIELRERRMQVLPKALRGYPPNAPLAVRLAQWCWHWLYRIRP